MNIVTIQLETDVAQIYQSASITDQKKLQLLLSLCLREFTAPAATLSTLMDEISARAEMRGLTPDILESLLYGK